MNVKLLRRVAKHILAEPKRFLMRAWVVRARPNQTYYNDDRYEAVEFAKCGTAACIAGWTCILGGKPKARSKDIAARKLLGIDREKERALFYTSNWPAKYEDRYYEAETVKSRARIAAQRIEHFIKTGE